LGFLDGQHLSRGHGHALPLPGEALPQRPASPGIRPTGCGHVPGRLRRLARPQGYVAAAETIPVRPCPGAGLATTRNRGEASFSAAAARQHGTSRRAEGIYPCHVRFRCQNGCVGRAGQPLSVRPSPGHSSGRRRTAQLLECRQ
jgi:hypothetical protein